MKRGWPPGHYRFERQRRYGKQMSELSSQIETLYRVIGQIRPGSEETVASAPRPPASQPPQARNRRAGAASISPVFTFYCLWFSLPLSVWFSSGWIGLFFYWRTLSCAARLLNLCSRIALFSRIAPFSPRPSFPRKGSASVPSESLRPRLRAFHPTQGGAQCSAIELEAH
jgi:hypothetical protein